MRNPESMRPTQASRTRIMVEANQAVGKEAFVVMEESRIAQNAVIYDRAQDFLNGIDYGKRK